MPCFVAALIVFLISDADVFKDVYKHVSNAIRKVFGRLYSNGLD